METKIFPTAISEHCVEVYDARISVHSNAVYLLLLAFFLLALSAIYWVKVDVTAQSRGTFQSALQRNPLISGTGGRLEKWNLAENQKVHKGEVLAVIRKETLHLEMQGIQERLELLEDFIRDLRILLKADFSHTFVATLPLKSHYFQASLFEFHTQLSNQFAAVQKLERDYNRARVLFDSQSLAFADFDEVEVRYKQALAQLDLIQRQKIHEWEMELNNYRTERLKMINQLKVYQEEMDQYVVIAGTNGTLINVLNLNEGDFIHPQQKLGEISPDTTLLAVTYISPTDIAFIHQGQEVSFQVDAYNYNQWGIARGRVMEVADDLTLINEKEAGFLVTCALDKPFLTLPQGVEGPIKKGMTFNARFVVARRSLFQLLYDKVDHWINPNVNQTSLKSWELK